MPIPDDKSPPPFFAFALWDFYTPESLILAESFVSPISCSMKHLVPTTLFAPLLLLHNWGSIMKNAMVRLLDNSCALGASIKGSASVSTVRSHCFLFDCMA